MFAGLVDPGKIAIVREILTPAATFLTGTVDTALFSAPLAGYTVTHNPDGSVTVSDAAGANVDGTDTLRNIEQAKFCTNLDAATGKCLASETLSLTGVPVATLSTTTLNFGQRALPAGPSAARVVTLSNTGAGSLNVTSSTIIGADAASFARTTNCGGLLTGTATCTFNVTFDPAAAGNRVAQLSIVTNAGTVVVNLTGTGVNNTAATGAPTISDTTPTEGTAITATDRLRSPTPTACRQRSPTSGARARRPPVPSTP